MNDMTINDILIVSGMTQVWFAIILGWGVRGMILNNGEKYGPFKNLKRLLQSHLDNVFMGLLQMAIAAVHDSIPLVAGFIFLAGSWANPQLLLTMAINPTAKITDLEGPVAIISFISLTIVYPWLIWAWLVN